MAFVDILHNLPEVKAPLEKKLSFNVKLKWTIAILAAFFVLSNIALYGADPGFLQQFEYLAIIMGTDFGSIISLGIGPIVMASIILQLLVGAQILEIDTSTSEGKKFFQGLQKLLVFFFILFEALVYVLMGGIKAAPGFTYIVIAQLVLGGLAILFMDEVCHKWGFGSGVSLFIAAGVGWRLVAASFGFLGPEGNLQASGAVIALISSLMKGDSTGTMLALAPIIVTIVLFLLVVWAQSLKIEIPLSYDRLRGYSMKWPLQFFYASVIPVILTAALFSVVWVKTSGMDASSQARNILNSGLQIPGFRKDQRILESILSRYVMPLTVMGGLAIGLLAALADVLGALVAGTALLLGIMITFQFYQNIMQQHAMDMNPAVKKMMGA